MVAAGHIEAGRTVEAVHTAEPGYIAEHFAERAGPPADTVVAAQRLASRARSPPVRVWLAEGREPVVEERRSPDGEQNGVG